VRQHYSTSSRYWPRPALPLDTFVRLTWYVTSREEYYETMADIGSPIGRRWASTSPHVVLQVVPLMEKMRAWKSRQRRCCRMLIELREVRRDSHPGSGLEAVRQPVLAPPVDEHQAHAPLPGAGIFVQNSILGSDSTLQSADSTSEDSPRRIGQRQRRLSRPASAVSSAIRGSCAWFEFGVADQLGQRPSLPIPGNTVSRIVRAGPVAPPKLR